MNIIIGGSFFKHIFTEFLDKKPKIQRLRSKIIKMPKEKARTSLQDRIGRQHLITTGSINDVNMVSLRMYDFLFSFP